MTYSKNVWKDQDVQRPRTYEVINNQDGSITLNDSFGVVTEIGTPVNATNMNHIEDGIFANDANITTIKSKIPSGASRSNKMATASDIATINTALTLKADKTQLHALKGYLDDGTALTDSEGLADVISYAHSTFDSTKFTVVGSPTITADGIASGFSNNNYMQLNNSIQIGASSNFKIEFQFTVGNTWVENWIFAAATANNFCLWLGKNNLDVYMNDVHIGNLNNGFAQNGSYKGYLKREGRIYTIYCENLKTHTSTTQTATMTEDYSFSGALWIGKSANSRDWSTDLKQFSITVDGKEVFNGNKEGLDVIKPDDYTVVGSPTITDDGVLVCSTTQTARTNYITTGALKPQALKGKSWEIKGSFYTGGGLDTFNNNILAIGNVEAAGIIYIPSADTLSFACNIGTSQSNKHSIGRTFTNIPKNTVINFSYKFDYRTKIYTFSYNDALQTSDASSYDEFELYNINTSNTQYSFQLGSLWANYDCTYPIDLNSFKIYVDGQLVYQPCLKIPYTLSKTGSKIADASVRNRVADMYNQQGYAPYYTLSDTDFTLPMGELYGMIEKTKTTGFLGQTVFSLDPLFNDGLHLLDGALLQGDGVYKSFIDNYIKPLYNSTPSRFVTETAWQQSVSTHGVCGYYVYDSTNNTVRLPKVTGFVEGTLDASALGSLVEAGLPLDWLNHTHTRGDMNITGNIVNNPIFVNAEDNSNGAFRTTNLGLALIGSGDGYQAKSISFDASRSWTGSTSAPNYATIAHNASTVQPQSIKGYLYIVVANNVSSVATVNQSGIITEVANKLDTDGSNAPSKLSEALLSRFMPDYSSVITISSPFTAPASGVVLFNNGGTTNCTVNGNTVYIGGNDNSNEGSVTLWVSKNDVITYYADSGIQCFISLKGV